MRIFLKFCVILYGVSFVSCHAEITRDLLYKGAETGLQVMQQAYYVNRHFAFNNLQIGTKAGPVRMVLLNGQRLQKGNTLVRQLNNAPQNYLVRFQDKVYFPSGRLKGTAILVVSYQDRPATYSLWLPALRKVRRVSEPAHDERWFGSPLTYGDLYFRKPKHETHEIVGRQSFEGCLHGIEMDDSVSSQLSRAIPDASCFPQGRQVYVVRSTTKFSDWWYDYRMVYVDAETFADYRSEYFKAGERVKIIDKDWRPLLDHDPRAVMWHYWYAKDTKTGQQALGYVNPDHILVNLSVNPQEWTERSLRKIKR